MKARLTYRRAAGSTFIVVLWIAFGLVSLALYFANSMSFELRAADNRLSALASEQAIDGAVRYLTSMLVSSQTNGVMPNPDTYLREAVPVGQASLREEQRALPHFWLIGSQTNAAAGYNQLCFGLVDEAGKLNLNVATSNEVIWLPGMTTELAAAMVDWRDTNGGSGSFDMFYGMQDPPYLNKSAPFETVEELKMLYGADLYGLFGEDLNRNGVLDPNETDENHNGIAEPGLLDCLTVYSREPSTYSNGVPRVDISMVTAMGPFASLLQSALGQSQASTILRNLVGAGQGTPGRFLSPLQLFRQSRMTSDDFAKIAEALTTRGTNDIVGRVNINTASVEVLACLPGLSDSPGLAQTLVNYRVQNPGRLASIAWIVDALGTSNMSVLEALERRDCITTQTFQFTADVAALGPFGRGYRRVRCVIDTMTGTPRILYRQDLSHLGWALGREVRQSWLIAKETR
jgi:type II secretory pathway component PulK